MSKSFPHTTEEKVSYYSTKKKAAASERLIKAPISLVDHSRLASGTVSLSPANPGLYSSDAGRTKQSRCRAAHSVYGAAPVNMVIARRLENPFEGGGVRRHLRPRRASLPAGSFCGARGSLRLALSAGRSPSLRGTLRAAVRRPRAVFVRLVSFAKERQIPQAKRRRTEDNRARHVRVLERYSAA